MDGVKLLRKLLNWLEELVDIALEYDERTDGNNAFKRHVAAHKNEDRKRRNVHNIRNRAVQCKGNQLLHVDFAQFLRAVFKIPPHIVFGCKYLHDLHARYMFRNKAVEFGYFRPHGAVDLPRGAAEHKCCNGDEWNHDENIKRELHVFRKHHCDHTHKNKAAFQNIHDNACEHFVHRFAIVRDACHKPADWVFIKEAYVQLHHVRENIVAQVVDNLLAHCGEDRRLRIGKRHYRKHCSKIQPAQLYHAEKVFRTQLLQLGKREPFVVCRFVFGYKVIYSLAQDLRLIQFKPHKDENDCKRQRKPAGIGFRIAEQPAVRGDFPCGFRLFCCLRFPVHSAYSSFFIFSNSCL